METWPTQPPTKIEFGLGLSFAMWVINTMSCQLKCLSFKNWFFFLEKYWINCHRYYFVIFGSACEKVIWWLTVDKDRPRHLPEDWQMIEGSSQIRTKLHNWSLAKIHIISSQRYLISKLSSGNKFVWAHSAVVDLYQRGGDLSSKNFTALNIPE